MECLRNRNCIRYIVCLIDSQNDSHLCDRVESNRRTRHSPGQIRYPEKHINHAMLHQRVDGARWARAQQQKELIRRQAGDLRVAVRMLGAKVERATGGVRESDWVADPRLAFGTHRCEVNHKIS